MGVIHGLEMINVRQNDTARRVGADRPFALPGEDGGHDLSIVQTRQRIEFGNRLTERLAQAPGLCIEILYLFHKGVIFRQWNRVAFRYLQREKSTKRIHIFMHAFQFVECRLF